MKKRSIFAMIFAFVILVAAAGYGTWALTVAPKSWEELGVSERVEFVTLIFTIGATLGAFMGLYFALKTLRSGDESLRAASKALTLQAQTLTANEGLLREAAKESHAITKLLGEAAKEAKRSTAIARGQFLILTRNVLANYDDINANFHRGGRWDWSKTRKGPETAEEWERTEVYMGTFEFCEIMLDAGYLDADEAKAAFGYRVKNIVSNPIVVHHKLELLADLWKRFIRLCNRLDVPIEPSEIKLGRPAEALAIKGAGKNALAGWEDC
jgi:hypothetical protein